MSAWLRKQLTIDNINIKLSRENLIRRGRILFIDDDRPKLIDDLKAAKFAVDYVPDITDKNLNIIETPIYDLILLDFGDVGSSIGQNQGLSILKHIKRVNPSVIVYAYTSKFLGAEHADFFRLANGVLPKDAGIGESTEIIEDGLRLAMSPKNLWSAFLQISGITPGSKEDLELQDSIIRGLNKPKDLPRTKEKVNMVLGEGAKIVGSVIIEKLIETGLVSLAS